MHDGVIATPSDNLSEAKGRSGGGPQDLEQKQSKAGRESGLKAIKNKLEESGKRSELNETRNVANSLAKVHPLPL